MRPMARMRGNERRMKIEEKEFNTEIGIWNCLPVIVGNKWRAMRVQQLLLIQSLSVVRKNAIHVQKLRKYQLVYR